MDGWGGVVPQSDYKTNFSSQLNLALNRPSGTELGKSQTKFNKVLQKVAKLSRAECLSVSKSVCL